MHDATVPSDLTALCRNPTMASDGTRVSLQAGLCANSFSDRNFVSSLFTTPEKFKVPVMVFELKTLITAKREKKAHIVCIKKWFEVFLLGSGIFLAEAIYNKLLRSMESNGNMAGLCFLLKPTEAIHKRFRLTRQQGGQVGTFSIEPSTAVEI